MPDPVRVRVRDRALVWTLVREVVARGLDMVELAAAGRRLVVPRADVYRVDEEPPREAPV